MTQALDRIHLTGFTSLADVTLAPGRLTVLIGANGSGKSNLIRALRMAPLMRTNSLQRFVGEAGGASALLYCGAKRTQAISIELDFVQDEHRKRYSARWASRPATGCSTSTSRSATSPLPMRNADDLHRRRTLGVRAPGQE